MPGVSRERRFVKICGVTRVEDAFTCAEAGATAVGLNFVPSSKRRVDEATARRIVDAVSERILVVAVVADLPVREMLRLREDTGIDWLQLHGSESPADLEAVLPHAFKAVPVANADDVRGAAAYGGDRLLVDAKVEGALGGTGTLLDGHLVRALARERRLILAGGLTPENVARAVELVRPWGVDVASGVESAPGRKDADKVRAFVAAARRVPA